MLLQLIGVIGPRQHFSVRLPHVQTVLYPQNPNAHNQTPTFRFSSAQAVCGEDNGNGPDARAYKILLGSLAVFAQSGPLIIMGSKIYNQLKESTRHPFADCTAIQPK